MVRIHHLIFTKIIQHKENLIHDLQQSKYLCILPTLIIELKIGDTFLSIYKRSGFAILLWFSIHQSREAMKRYGGVGLGWML